MLTMLRSAGFGQDTPKTAPFIIGDAKMMEDGTIVLNPQRTRDGINVSGIVKYPVNSPTYKEVLDHLGGSVVPNIGVTPANVTTMVNNASTARAQKGCHRPPWIEITDQTYLLAGQNQAADPSNGSYLSS